MRSISWLTLSTTADHVACLLAIEVGRTREERAISGLGCRLEGSVFCEFLSRRGSRRAFVDVNPYKQGRYVAGTGHQIVGPRGFVDIDPAFILTMNPAYTREITELVRELGSQAEIVPVLKE